VSNEFALNYVAEHVLGLPVHQPRLVSLGSSAELS
jgi:hypothetical protein